MFGYVRMQEPKARPAKAVPRRGRGGQTMVVTCSAMLGCFKSLTASTHVELRQRSSV